MVAEAVAETTEVVQPTGEALAESESAPEATPEAEAVNDDAALDAVLAQYVGDEATGETTDGATSTEGTTETPVAKLSPEEAFERGKQAQEQSSRQQQTVAQRQAQEQGIRSSFTQRKGGIVQMLTNAGVDAGTVMEVANQFDYHHGQALALNDMDLRDATSALQQQYAESLYQTAAALGVKELTDRRSEHLKSDSPIKTFLSDFADGVIKERKLLTPAEAKKQANDTVRAAFKKFPADVKKALGFTDSSTSTAQNAAGVGGRNNFKTLGEAEAAHAAGQISNADMRAILSAGRLSR